MYLTIVVKMLGLRRVIEQMRDESHAAVGGWLGEKSNVELVKGNVQIGEQERGCGTSRHE
jgi:hypothetical protein